MTIYLLQHQQDRRPTGKRLPAPHVGLSPSCDVGTAIVAATVPASAATGKDELQHTV